MCPETCNVCPTYVPTASPTFAGGCAGSGTITAGSSMLTYFSGSISDGPHRYVPSMRCQWVIQSPGPITLSFRSLNTEHSYDFVKVFDGDGERCSLLGSFSGTVLPADVTASAGAMTILFTTDSTLQKDGFVATYHATTTVQRRSSDLSRTPLQHDRTNESNSSAAAAILAGFGTCLLVVALVVGRVRTRCGLKQLPHYSSKVTPMVCDKVCAMTQHQQAPLSCPRCTQDEGRCTSGVELRKQAG